MGVERQPAQAKATRVDPRPFSPPAPTRATPHDAANTDELDYSPARLLRRRVFRAARERGRDTRWSWISVGLDQQLGRPRLLSASPSFLGDSDTADSLARPQSRFWFNYRVRRLHPFPGRKLTALSSTWPTRSRCAFLAALTSSLCAY